LKEYRQAAINILNSYEGTPLAMEFFMARSGEPKEVCKKEIKKCDIFVGIYAYRYGFIPNGEEKSITQQEYEFAKKLRKDCLCFVVKKGSLWNPDFIEIDKYKKLQDFLAIVKDENVVAFFESPADFSAKFAVSLWRLIAEKTLGIELKYRVGGGPPCIPFAPAPFIAHPYPLPAHFTGRTAEQAMLSNWFHNEEEPVLVMEAIGGMGKSALTWVWMQQEILERSVEIEGVFWWSFYDSPFEAFLQHLVCYVMRYESTERGLLSADVPKLQAALHNRRFLLVLDGLERALRGYAGMEAMFIQEKRFEEGILEEDEWDKRQREPVHPLAARFLKNLAAKTVKTRTLITTRLMPTPFEGLVGAKHKLLTGLSPGDTVYFLRSEGVKGTRAELEQAGKIYDYHPLMLKLLASTIIRSRKKDIQEAIKLNFIDRQEPQKILIKSFNLLSKEEQQVASSAAVFRSVFNFDAAKALFPKIKENHLWQVMQELRNLGFLLNHEKDDHFDFHPIMRSFLYNQLTNRTEAHIQAAQYFQALPKVEKIVSLEDLAPVIELYHHLVKAKKFDEAFCIFYERINKPTYYQLSAYYLINDLLKEFFPDGEKVLPPLKGKKDQAEILNDLAATYSLSGLPDKALLLFRQSVEILEKIDKKEYLAIALGNVAKDQFRIGKLSASIVYFRKENLIGQKIGNNKEIADSYRDLGRVLLYQGKTKIAKSLLFFNGESFYAEDELKKAIKIFKRENNIEGLALASAYCSLFDLTQAQLTILLSEGRNQSTYHIHRAMRQALKFLKYAEEKLKTKYPFTRDFVHFYWLLGESLIQCTLLHGAVRIKSFEIPFYDEFFQQKKESIAVKSSNKLEAAERCINESLCRCRSVNLVELEPDILVTHARLEWAKISSQSEEMRSDSLPSIEKTLEEAQEIAQRAGYRLKLADLHLFCGQVLLELKEKTTLLGLNAYDHLQKTKEYALDVSEFSDLYQSPDPDFYKGIPEYDMLKRGMTHEERIRNGYWVAYKIAETLEKQFNTKGK
jgi:tetratricopeptide (TPR) repeat protein